MEPIKGENRKRQEKNEPNRLPIKLHFSPFTSEPGNNPGPNLIKITERELCKIYSIDHITITLFHLLDYPYYYPY